MVPPGMRCAGGRLASPVIGAVLAMGCLGQIDGVGPASIDEAGPAGGAGRGGAGRGGAGRGGAGGAPAGAQPMVPAAPGSMACAAPPARIWKLTPAQYTRTVQRLLGTTLHPADDLRGTLPSKSPFSNEAGTLEMPQPHTAELRRVAGLLAREAARAPAVLRPCLAEQSVTETCVRGFVQDFGARAFRRPVTAPEVSAYYTFFQARQTAGGAGTALRLLIEGFLLSPSFLFRTELGPEEPHAPGSAVALTSAERAAALSYFLTDGPPDAELAGAAAARAIESREQVAAQARRLLAQPSVAAGVLTLFEEHFELSGVQGALKDSKVFPMWRDSVAADLAREAGLFVEDALSGGGRLETLLVANVAFVTPRLATLYGLPQPAGAGPQKMILPVGRIGLFTLPAVMALNALQDESDPVKRGFFIRNRALCESIPIVPPGIPPPPPRATGSWRERLKAHTVAPECAACHRDADSVGLAFEHYDGIGRYRTTEEGKAIEAGGVTRIGAGEARFLDAGDLARQLARAPETRRCLVETAFTYAYGRAPTDADACFLTRLSDRFEDKGGDMIDLLVALVADDAFLIRRIEQRY